MYTSYTYKIEIPDDERCKSGVTQMCDHKE